MMNEAVAELLAGDHGGAKQTSPPRPIMKRTGFQGVYYNAGQWVSLIGCERLLR